MSGSRLRSLNSLLGGADTALKSLASQAAARVDLCRRVRGYLPETLREHLIAVSVDAEGAAVVTLDSAAWATRLRYDSRPLADALRAAGIEAREIRVKVAPAPRSS